MVTSSIERQHAFTAELLATETFTRTEVMAISALAGAGAAVAPAAYLELLAADAAPGSGAKEAEAMRFVQ
ncbi:hypothetical protein [Rhizobium sp. BK491]|uniref:hypothetical protein n=1 Tax=Rhizobium sp. BK491 TaxID=2587009 RepID=UPI001859B130|nr:hypothetical protein [Rhizobium sp. BK491]MBB3572032.1 hypothetical protein [Rhizobium sp. BK491]